VDDREAAPSAPVVEAPLSNLKTVDPATA
jgi:hypothetical protein